MPERRIDSTFVDAALAVGGQAPQVGAADHHGPRPSAIALTTSLPRRMPPSRSTSTWSPTAATTAGRERIAPGVPSRLLPPCVETEMAETPASTARRASSGRLMPLSRNGPAPLLAEPGDVLPAGQRGLHPLAVGAEERRAPARRPRPCSARSGRGSRRCAGRWRASAGLRSTSGANRSACRTSIFSGMGGAPQSRRVANDQSRVTIRPWAPAARARSARARMRSRSPDQYSWKNELGVGRAATSSTGLLAKELQAHRGARGGGGPGDGDLAVGVHGLHAGGGDEHGERDVLAHDGGRELALLRAGRRRADGSRSSSKARTLSLQVRPFSVPATSAEVDRAGQPLLRPDLGLGDGLEPVPGARHAAMMGDRGTGCTPGPGVRRAGPGSGSVWPFPGSSYSCWRAAPAAGSSC